MSVHRPHPRLAGIELYFDDLPRAKAFYADVLGLDLAEEQAGHHAQVVTGTGFVCLERRGVEDYPSADKAGLFLEVLDLARALEGIGSDRVVRAELNAPKPWAVLHDPEGHNILLLQAGRGNTNEFLSVARPNHRGSTKRRVRNARLCRPQLKRVRSADGELLVRDNLASHRARKVRSRLEAADAH